MDSSSLNLLKTTFAKQGLLASFDKDNLEVKVVLSESSLEEALQQAMSEVEFEIKSQLKSRKITLKTLVKKKGQVVVTSEEMNPYELALVLKNGCLGKHSVPTENGLVINAKTFGRSVEERSAVLLKGKRECFKKALTLLIKKGVIAMGAPMNKESDLKSGAEVVRISL